MYFEINEPSPKISSSELINCSLLKKITLELAAVSKFSYVSGSFKENSSKMVPPFSVVFICNEKKG